MSYLDIYEKRMNRFGTNQIERALKQRQICFANLLQTSSYKISFLFQDIEYLGIIKEYTQTAISNLRYLLTETSLDLPNGTIIKFNEPNTDKELVYMVFWNKTNQAKGYNKYIILQMDYLIEWEHNGNSYSSWIHKIGPADKVIDDYLKDKSLTGYSEDENRSVCIAPFNQNLFKNDFFTIQVEDRNNGFVVTGIDMTSTPKIMYFSINNNYIEDTTKMSSEEIVSSETNFWLTGGEENGT